MATGFVCVATFRDLTEAHLAKGVLEAAGIDAEIRHGDVSGLEPHLPGGPRVELWCASGESLRARAELARGEQPAAPPRLRASWTVVAILALTVTSILGWVRVWSLERPQASKGSWNLSGTAYADEDHGRERLSIDHDRNGVFERVELRGRGRLTTWLDADQDGFAEVFQSVEEAGGTSDISSDTDGDGEYDFDVVTVPGRGRVETTWVPPYLPVAHSRVLAPDGGLVAHFTDADHDGRFERGVFHVSDGLVITSEDRDGDGFFERREVMRDGGLVFWDRLRADGVIERGP